MISEMLVSKTWQSAQLNLNYILTILIKYLLAKLTPLGRKMTFHITRSSLSSLISLNIKPGWLHRACGNVSRSYNSQFLWKALKSKSFCQCIYRNTYVVPMCRHTHTHTHTNTSGWLEDTFIFTCKRKL